MIKYIDSHCHLPKNSDFSDVLARAKLSGVMGCVINAVDASEWNQICDIASKNKNVCGAIGIHPWAINTAHGNWADDIDFILSSNPNLILGEVGIDKTRDDILTQERIFTRQIEIAIKHRRTICLHCVHAWDIVLRVFKTYRRDLPTIIAHAFDGTQNAIDFDTNIYFSYSPNVAMKNFQKMRIGAINTPRDKILIESDSCVLSDVSKSARGVLKMRADITANDIFNNSLGVFFNGQIA